MTLFIAACDLVKGSLYLYRDTCPQAAVLLHGSPDTDTSATAHIWNKLSEVTRHAPLALVCVPCSPSPNLAYSVV